MFKKHALALSCLLYSTSMVAVLLKKGNCAPYYTTLHVWSSLKYLRDHKDYAVIDTLFTACLEDTYVIPRGQYLTKASQLGLCDTNGKINPHIAHVILAAVNKDQDSSTPLSIRITSPIHWKNYLSLKYLLGRLEA